jgi:hypothetical protein
MPPRRMAGVPSNPNLEVLRYSPLHIRPPLLVAASVKGCVGGMLAASAGSASHPIIAPLPALYIGGFAQ